MHSLTYYAAKALPLPPNCYEKACIFAVSFTVLVTHHQL